MLDRGGGRLALSHLDRPVEELLGLTGLREIFFIFSTEAEAVQSCTILYRTRFLGHTFALRGMA